MAKTDKAQKANTGDKGSYIPALDEANARYDINTSAEKVHRRDWLIRIIAVILALLVFLLGIGYACTVVINNAGRFTVSMVPNLYGVQLSDTEDFANPTLNLYATPIEGMDNITRDWILNKDGRLGDDPVYDSFEDIDAVYGDHNGTNYLAYTFAVRNAGSTDDTKKDETVDYRATLQIVSSYLGADEAIRVMVFVNGESTIYAKARKGTDGRLESFAADKNFVAEDVVLDDVRSDMKKGETDRYTVIVWLEGEDPECVNDIMGGEVKLKMDFSVIGGTDEA